LTASPGAPPAESGRVQATGPGHVEATRPGRVHVVLINYRTPELTLLALASVLEDPEGLPGTRVSLVENDSRDGSLEKLSAAIEARGWGDRVALSASPRNGGFSYGVNRGVEQGLARHPRPDFLYLLNSDARLAPGALARLVAFLDAHPEVGIAGSHIHGPDGEPHRTAFRFPSLAGELESALGLGLATRLLERWVVARPLPTAPERVDWLAGASMLVRREVFEQVGPFDETFFLYYEETDFCRRAAAAGWPAWYVPESRVEHVGSASTGWQDHSKPRSPWWFEGRRYYFYKTHGRPYLWATNVAWLAGHLLWRVRKAVQRKPDLYPPRFLRDFLRHNFGLRPLPEPRR